MLAVAVCRTTVRCGQLGLHAVRSWVTLAIDRRCGALAFSTQRNIGVDALTFELLQVGFLAVAGICQEFVRCACQGCLGLFQNRQQPATITGVVRQLIGHNYLEIAIYGQLAVVALLVAIGGGHDVRFGIGEVGLSFGLRNTVVAFVG